MFLDQQNSVSIYIHWPFCVKKCPYCSFNSYPLVNFIDFDYWKNAYLLAIQFYAEKYKDRTIKSIYFGGGSPSMLPNNFIGDLIKAMQNCWKFSKNVEITIEFRPDDVTEEKMNNLYESKVNRISIGAQSLNNECLEILRRRHNIETIFNAIEVSSKLFKNISLDMIYAHPGHYSINIWEEELKIAVKLNTQHLSLYQLIVDENTVFGSMQRKGKLLLPDEDSCAEMFEITQKITENEGFYAYEISNHAKKGYECVHNIRYWQYQDYIGIGPGAHGRIMFEGHKYAILEEKNPQKWVDFISNEKRPLIEMDRLTLEEQTREILIVSLRTSKGLDCRKLPALLEECVEMPKLKQLINEGYLEYKDNILRGTSEGRKVLNSLILFLLK
ncbi:MAG: radical SAM family heme chaperone HemW [Holosporales bacterium]|jgi:oxygen-independent coproporphyrinogen-3 oxidase|nr:radical SAM family heme chaperone HemW [Holosporales bacterium]